METYHSVLAKIENESSARAKLFIIQAIKKSNFTAVEIADLFSVFADKVKTETKENYKAFLIKTIENA